MPYYPPTFDEDDSMWVPAAAIANVAGTAGATYAGNEQTILTNTQAAVNSILVALRAANIIAED
jgi:hypothetical protein